MATALVACGSLKQQLEVILGEEWKERIFYLPQILHLNPNKLHLELDALLSWACSRYRQVIVVYGKCTGDIDALVEKHGAIRVPGELCYEMFAGETFFRLLQEEPGTYFLTESLCRNFHEQVIKPLYWEEKPALKNMMLKNYRRAVFLDTVSKGVLDEKARQVADYLGLPLEIRRVGLDNFRQRLQETLSQVENAV